MQAAVSVFIALNSFRSPMKSVAIWTLLIKFAEIMQQHGTFQDLCGVSNGKGAHRKSWYMIKRFFVTARAMMLARKVSPGLQDLQKRTQRILAERNAEKAEENTWIGRMIAAENINDMKVLIKSRDSA